MKANITGDGVWRVRRKERSASIEVFRVEETGHGDILSDEFINWRIKLALNKGSSEAPTVAEEKPSMETDPAVVPP